MTNEPIPVHLANAAKHWAEVLSQLHPEYSFVGVVKPLHRDEWDSGTTPTVGAVDDTGAVADDANTVCDGDALPAAGASDDDGFDEAA